MQENIDSTVKVILGAVRTQIEKPGDQRGPKNQNLEAFAKILESLSKIKETYK